MVPSQEKKHQNNKNNTKVFVSFSESLSLVRHSDLETGDFHKGDSVTKKYAHFAVNSSLQNGLVLKEKRPLFFSLFVFNKPSECFN